MIPDGRTEAPPSSSTITFSPPRTVVEVDDTVCPMDNGHASETYGANVSRLGQLGEGPGRSFQAYTVSSSGVAPHVGTCRFKTDHPRGTLRDTPPKETMRLRPSGAVVGFGGQPQLVSIVAIAGTISSDRAAAPGLFCLDVIVPI